jgi:hypothetical protein
MVKKTDRPTTPRHVLIYDEDWEFLERYFGAGAPRHRRVGCGHVCREYIHQGVMELRQRIAEHTAQDFDLEDDEEELEDV